MKKPYVKPVIKRTKLIAEEAVLTTCKTTASKTASMCTAAKCGGSANSPS